jgi:UPF0755 protein
MRFILSLFSFSYLILIGIALGVAGLIIVFQMPGPFEEAKEIQIQRGMGTQSIGQYLQDEKLIYNKYPFIAGAQFLNRGKPLQAGEFEIPAQASTAQILDILQNGKTIQRKFMIPEGQTSWQIVQILNENEFLDGEIEDIPPEGSLMPETYFFSKGDSRLEKISRMQQAMASFVSEQDTTILESLPLETMEEVVILASIVEKETSVPSEYAKVAGVFHNRLRIGMALQTDPTVIYGITGGEHKDDGRGPLGRRLLTRDLQKDTPFNTYTRTGLPPTPICNPGRAAITAVLNPADHDYLFFVADGTGGHAFAKTYKEHQANVAKWRQIRRNQ